MQQMTLGRNMRLERNANEVYTINFGDCVQSEKDMQLVGKRLPSGFSVDKLKEISKRVQGSELVDLSNSLRGAGLHYLPEAAVLVVRKGVETLLGSNAVVGIYKELRAMPKDKQSFIDGIVRNKMKRHNLCVADFSQAPDFPKGKGTVVCFDEYSHTAALRVALAELVGLEATQLMADVDHYHDVQTCGISWHGKAERTIVIGTMFGGGSASMPLKFRWVHEKKQICEPISISLEAGDIYIMCNKTVGHDKYSSLALQHCVEKDSGIRARTKREREDPVLAARATITEQQRERMEANRQKALAIRARVEGGVCV